MTRTFETAIRYAQSGIPVFPLNGRKPAVERGFHDATTDIDFLRHKWDDGEADWNIGIPTGSVSGFFALDVDRKPDGPDGFQALKELASDPRGLTETVVQKTGWGAHFLFRCSGERIPCSVSKIGPGLDIKGDGGYIIVSPSRHSTGRRYEWIEGKSLLERDPGESHRGFLSELAASQSKSPTVFPLDRSIDLRNTARLPCRASARKSGPHRMDSKRQR